MKTSIYTTITKEGYHSFPGAATLPKFATNDGMDVSHLANKHMHYFKIRVWLQVSHSNRQVEFIQLHRWLENYYGDKALDFGASSCEMIAEELIKSVAKKYPTCDIKVEVAEDDINGAVVEYDAR
jgi:hypothetical protein